MESISLPELMYGPKRYNSGYIQQLLMPYQTSSITRIEKIQVGPKTFEDCLILESGQRIVVTRKTKLAIPAGTDGVLRLHEAGHYTWVDHTKLSEVNIYINKHGMKDYCQKVAMSWQPSFRYSPSDYEPNTGLRPPQLGALFAIASHWSLHKTPATIVMPTGTGKTETMLAVLASQTSTPMIVAVPSKNLRKQTMRKFLTFGLLRKLGLLPENIPNPVVGVLTKQPKSESDLDIFDNCNVLIAVIPSLAGGEAKALAKNIADRCETLVVDEAHHIGAKTWTEFRESFSTKRVLQFTATPFRSDGKLVDGELIFTYPLRSAQEDGYFKPIKFLPIHELEFQAADKKIAQEACSALRKDLASGFDHLMMARCDSIERAEEVLKLYLEYGREFNPQIIHSELSDSEVRIERLIKSVSRIAVCVNMLGEGFDLPALKIAALHDPQKSLGPMLQFTGRFTRSSGANLGDATIIANIADPNISVALERLYSEDSDWNYLLSELSSEAAKDHARLIEFLNESKPLSPPSEELPNVSHHLLRPTLSTLTFECSDFSPKKFHEGLPKGQQIVSVWLNEKASTLFFVTRSEGRVKWTRSKEIIDSAWNLFVLHHDQKLNLLYLASSDKSSTHEELAKSVGAGSQLSGELIFRSLGGIGRLVFNNLGVTKHGRRNLSYAMYTGSDVRRALGLSEKAGSRKANLSGVGWEQGRQITIGCSYKGRVWSKEAGTIPRFIEWAQGIGAKLSDSTIDTADIIDNVLIPDEVKKLPETEILGIEWPVEMLRQAEERIDIEVSGRKFPIFLLDISIDSVDHSLNAIYFSIISNDGEEKIVSFSICLTEETGYEVKQITDTPASIHFGSIQIFLEDYFNKFPPLIRFVDLAELDGNLILKPQNPYELQLPPTSLNPWQWSGTDLTKESIWKSGKTRKDSIQWVASQKYIADGFNVVFDDDGSGEAADLVCIKEEDTYIRLVLVHCKFSGGENSGVRIQDIVEVSSQAIRSTKWAGRFKELCRHIINRYERRRASSPTRVFTLAGDMSDISRISKSARFKEVRPEIVVIQPGISAKKISKDQAIVFAAASTYIKETIGIDLIIICSE